MRAKFLLATLFLLAGQAFGQFIQITGTAQDNIGLPYANGTIVPVLNVSASPTINGVPYVPPQQPFGLDINGKFAFNLAANNQISPSGSTWSFIICSGPGTVSIAWGRQSACFQVNTLTLNAAQDITAQISTSAQPLTYSASFLAAASPTCPLADGIVDLDFVNQDLAHRASVEASVLDSQVAVGVAVYVPGAQCLGVVQVATGLVVPIYTDNSSTIGDFVTSSSITRGQVHDYGSTVSATTRTYGQVIQANTGPGTISMVLYTGGGSGGGGGGGGGVGNCPIDGGVGWYQFAGTTIGCNVNLTADSLGNLTALGYFLNGSGTLEIQSTTFSGGLPSVCAANGTCLSFDTSGILNGSINGGAWFPYLNAFTGVLWDQITDRDTTGVTDFSRFFDLLANINCASPFVCVGGGVANSGLVNSSTMSDDLTNPVASPDGLNARTQGYYGVEIPANASTGVGQFLMGCDDGSGALLVCNHTTSTTNVPAGVVEACNNAASPPTKINCGTTGNAIVSAYGFLTVKFDNTATALHYAQQSSSVDGELSDVGATAPTNGQPFYFIWIGNAGAGTAGVIRILTGTELAASGTGSGTIEIQTNGSDNANCIAGKCPLLNNATGSASVSGVQVTPTNTSGGTVAYNVTDSSTQASNPSQPTATVNGTPGSTDYKYAVTGCEDGPTCAKHSAESVVVNVPTGAATITSVNSITLSGYADTLYGYRCYNIYRTSSSGSPGSTGLIANCAGHQFIDTGLAGDSTTPPASNNTVLSPNIGDPTNTCAAVPMAPRGVDAPPCVPTVFNDEGSQTFGAPADTNDPLWTWLNQNGATAAYTGGMTTLTSPSRSAADNLNCLIQTAPSAPYSFTGLLYPNVNPITASANSIMGVAFYESGTGKAETWGIQYNASGYRFLLGEYSSTTVLASTLIASNLAPNPIYVRIQNDGSNLKFYNSPDGVNFNLAQTQTLTTFFTVGPNRVGFCIDNNNDAGGAIDVDYWRRTQ